MRSRTPLLVALFLAVVALPAAAQTPPTDSARRARDTLSLDSLLARLERAEAAIAILRQQIADESESAVQTRSRFHLELSAQILMNSFLTVGRVNNTDDPQTVLVPPSAGLTPPRNSALGVTLRQTRLGAATSIDNVAGATFAGDIDIDFFGGVQNGSGDRRLFPELRMRTARAHLFWPRTELMFGSDTPLISDLNPLSLAAVGIPDFSGAGNLWNWLGQMRITQDIGSLGGGPNPLRLAIQGAVMTPYAAQLAPGEPDIVDAGERSSRPAFEGRLRMRWGANGSSFAPTISGAMIGSYGGEVGLGMHHSWIATSPGVLKESHAISLDGHMVLLPHVEIRGEAYAGRLLRGLGGGGIAQNFGNPPIGALPNSLGPPIRDVAGWAQLNVQPREPVITGVGCGIDAADPHDNPTRLQNTVCAGHVEWRPVQPLVFGFEYRQLWTRFSDDIYVARHFNLIFGFEL
ncbi:MAG TPA: hypothetical protein VGH98_13155 [Gemmatimonadaceae bacterium]